jgi:membrane-associated phospholipid phosphatase
MMHAIRNADANRARRVIALLSSLRTYPAFGLCVASTGTAVAMLLVTHTGVRVDAAFLGAIGGTTVLVLLHVLYASPWRTEPRISAMAGSMAVLIWGSLMAMIAAMAALRTGAPLVDTILARIDAAMGLSTRALVLVVAAHPSAGHILAVAYALTVPAIFAAALFLAWTRQISRLWRFCFIHILSALTCGALSAIVPAIGAIIHDATPGTVLAALPPGSGRYYQRVFELYRSGSIDMIDIRQMEGVVDFPSFHAIMAVMIPFAAYGYPILSVLAWAWCLLVLISTIPIGGHYTIDILGGLGVFALFAGLSRPADGAARTRAAIGRD